VSLHLDSTLVTGDPRIDDQHREIFARVAALVDASRENRGREEVGRLLDFLGDYVVTHFGAEERLMADARYPGVEAHRAEHARFVREFTALRQEFQEEGPGVLFVIRVGNRVTAWIREHIYRTDRAFADFLHARAAGGPAAGGGGA
jgi:hemerythrin